MNGYVILCCFLIISFYATIFLLHHKLVYDISNISGSNWLLVLGAGIEKNNRPSPILEDRLVSALKFIRKFNPKHIVLSGTKRRQKYNEPSVMMNYIVSAGVNQDSIIFDESGFSTFHSIMNIKTKYDPGKIIIVSQRFHLYRSLLISRLLGFHSIGLAADNISFSNNLKAYWYFRECVAIPYNLIKILFFHIFRNEQ